MLRDEYHYVLASLGARELQLGDYAHSGVNISSFALHAYSPPAGPPPMTAMRDAGAADAADAATGTAIDVFGARSRRLLASLSDLLDEEGTDPMRTPARTQLMYS